MSVKGLYTEYLGWAIPVASAVSLILSFLPGGSTGLSDSVHDRPVFPGISPAYGPVQFLFLPLAAAQPVFMRHRSHQVDKHVIDGGYHGAGDWGSLRGVFI